MVTGNVNECMTYDCSLLDYESDEAPLGIKNNDKLLKVKAGRNQPG